MRRTILLLLATAPLLAQDDARAWAEAVVADAHKQGMERAPDFPADLEWLNVRRPLSLRRELKGKVVLLDFWCYCCINCIHVLPDLEYLEKKYAGKAFAVVGVHSAKFDNERDTDKIREAVRRYEIKHPVVNDAGFLVWRGYGARSWPTFAIVTPDGKLLGTLSGEGHRKKLDALVAVLLERYKDRLDARPLPVRLEGATRAPGMLAYPGKVLAHGDSLFIADSNHNRIVEVDRHTGVFRRAWGDGRRGLVDGKNPRFFRPQGMAARKGVLYVADTENHAIRAIDLETGLVSTVGGNGKQGHLRRGAHNVKNISLSSPWDLEWIGDHLYIAMAGTHQIWRWNGDRVIEVFAGDGSERRFDSEYLPDAAFAQPSGLAWDGKWLYLADSESSAIVKIGLERDVVTVAGAKAGEPRNLFFFGDQDGVGWGRRFQHPLGIEHVDGLLYVADTYNHKIKSVDPKTRQVRSLWGGFDEPGGLTHADRILYVADTNHHLIKTIDLQTNKVATLALKRVPIPQASARKGGVGEEWPELGAEQRKLTLKGKEVLLELALPEGWKLTEGAPSALQVDGKTRALGRTTQLALAPGRHELRLLYYVCQEAGTCRMRAVDFELTLEAGEGTVSLRDIFEP